MSVWISSGAFSSSSMKDVMAEAAYNRISRIELASGLQGGNDPAALIQSGLAAGQTYLIHNYFPAPAEPFVLNVAAADEAMRERSVAFARDAIDLAHIAGAPFYSLHAGFAAVLPSVMLGQPAEQARFLENKPVDREHAREIMLDTTRCLAKEAEARGMGLLLENNVVTAEQVENGRTNPLLLTSPDECVAFFEALGMVNVGLLLDVGHAKVSAGALRFDPADFFRACEPWIRCLHLSDNDGYRDTNQLIEKTAWFLPWLPYLADCPMVLEVYRIDKETISAQVNLIERAAGL